jgi:hypothetical protein
MRSDHAFPSPFPTREEIERSMRRAHRMRSEAVHGYLRRAVEWLRGGVRRTAAGTSRKVPAPQHC